MVKVNAQAGKTASLASPKNGNFWGKPEEEDVREARLEKKEAPTHRASRKTIVKGA